MLNKEEIDKLNISNLHKVHFIGITSAFNSFCANYLITKGVKVTASEIKQDSTEAQDWIAKGILYAGGHNAEYITDDIDLVIYPNGPIPGNPECEETERKGIHAITIAQMTGIISKNFKVIAIAGTHGKTTTSSLIVWMLYKHLGYLPNFMIGDNILEINKAWNYNPETEYLVVEACEYKRQFLDRVPTPYISVITNIEIDHTDYYKSQQDYDSAFSTFISNTSNFVILDKKGINVNDVLSNTNTKAEVLDTQEFENKYKNVTAGLSGVHNRENILRACGVAYALNIKPEIEDFPGVASRFEYKGDTPNNMPVYLDYAHNPKKIRACLQEAKEKYPEKKVVFVWQPHSYERSYSFRDDFTASLNDADFVFIPNIFAPTREQDQYKDLITAESFVDYLKEKNPDKDIRYTENFEKTADILKEDNFNVDCVCVLASAGNLKDIIPLLNLSK
jgi:UDP-N-acetylmuramate--alanine ligase